ncbi:MAG: hypothetical protein VKK59_01050 [Vampirovibrionales bacterium]|nr:hypothetical protein [Vampirovibrionales bacterium]
MLNSVSNSPASSLTILYPDTPSNPLENNAAENTAVHQAERSQESPASTIQDRPYERICDEATISEAAIARLRQSNEMRPFVQKAMSQSARSDYDVEKVSALRGLVQSGRISEYLSIINPSQLANAILQAPAGKLLILPVGA